MIFNKMLRRTDGDIAFKKLAKEYRYLQKDLQDLKDYALELQKKNKELIIENEKLKLQIRTKMM